MQLTYTATLGFLVTLAAASAPVERADEILDFLPLEKRDVTGAEYECHSNCGHTILNSRNNDGYCDDSEWQKLLSDCLDCAGQYGMWGNYGKQVEKAAEGCGLEAVPKGSEESATSAASTTLETSTVVKSSSEAPAQSSAAATESSAVAETTPTAASSASAEASDAAETGITTVAEASTAATQPAVTSDVPATSSSLPSNSTTSAVPSSVPDSGVAQTWVPRTFIAGAIIAAVANLM